MDSFMISHDFTSGSPLVSIDSELVGSFYARNYSISFNLNVLHERVVGWDDEKGQFYVPENLYPYRDFVEQRVPTTEKPGGARAALSNLRGTITNNPSAAKASTLILGGSATSGFGK